MKAAALLDLVFKLILSLLAVGLSLLCGCVWFVITFAAEGGGWTLTLMKIVLLLLTVALPALAVKLLLSSKKEEREK